MSLQLSGRSSNQDDEHLELAFAVQDGDGSLNRGRVSCCVRGDENRRGYHILLPRLTILVIEVVGEGERHREPDR